MIIHIKSYDEFKECISSSSCFVDFYTSWCGPCKMLSPIIEELDENGSFGDIKVLKIDAEECPEISREYKIQAVPTLMLFKGGEVVKTAMGYMSDSDLLEFIK